jgi:CRP/FNR family transcriptional regulator, nitrogen fixation regulation protein
VRLLKRRSLKHAANNNVQVARKLWGIRAGAAACGKSYAAARTQERDGARRDLPARDDPRLAAAGMMALPMCRRDIGDFSD